MTSAPQVPEVARLAQEAVENGMCAVIGLQSTGEANTDAVVAEKVSAFIWFQVFICLFYFILFTYLST